MAVHLSWATETSPLWLLGTDPAAIPADVRQIQAWLKQSITSTAHTLLLTHTQRLALINATKFPAPKRTRSVRHDDGGLADWLGLTPGP